MTMKTQKSTIKPTIESIQPYEQSKQGDEFTWIGNGILKNEKENIKHYNSFQKGKLVVHEGDCVLIATYDSADPDHIDNCDVAQVKSFYQSDDLMHIEDEPYRATVQWYTRPRQVPKDAIRKANIILDDKYEVLLETRNFSTQIDAESIVAKCEVIIGKTSDDALAVAKAHLNGHPIFVARYGIRPIGKHGHSVRLYPLITPDIDLSDLLSPVIIKNKLETGRSVKTARRSLNSALNVSSTNQSRSSSPVIPKTEPAMRFECMPDDMSAKLNSHKNSQKKRKRNDIKSSNISDDGYDSETPKKTRQVPTFSSPITSREVHSDNNSTNIVITTLSGRKRRFMCHLVPVKDGNKDSGIANVSDKTTDMEKKLKETFTASKTKRSASQNLPGRYGGLEDLEISTFLLDDDDDNDSDENVTLGKITNMHSNNSVKLRNNKESEMKVTVPEMIIRAQDKKARNVIEPEKASLGISPPKMSHVRRQLKLDDTPVSNAASRQRKTITPAKGTAKEKGTPKGTVTPKSKGTPKQKGTPRTPSTLAARNTPIENSKNKFEVAQRRLQVCSVPSTLPCRENEYESIYRFVESKLVSSSGGCMYVSGVPGTGKTATVLEVVRCLNIASDNGDVPEFEFVELNGMKLTDPQQVYSQLWLGLTGQKVPTAHALKLLDKRFKAPSDRKRATLLLVDELDLLFARKQSVMYNLFEWPTWPHAKLIVVAIANTMDLPERVMINRVASRLGLTRLSFHPYNFNQLTEIVASRVTDLQVFDPDAVQLVARKVAAVSGDARRALDICRRAAEIAHTGETLVSLSPVKKGLVGLAHVTKALQEMFSSPKMIALSHCTLYQKYFLQAVVSDFRRTGLEETTLDRVYEQMMGLCTFEGTRVLTLSNISSICNTLTNMRLILSDQKNKNMFQKIWLNVSTEDVNFSFNKSK